MKNKLFKLYLKTQEKIYAVILYTKIESPMYKRIETKQKQKDKPIQRREKDVKKSTTLQAKDKQ